MSGTLISNVQMGDSVTAANNFVITAEANDGTMKLARGNKGATTQDVMTVDAAGQVAFPSQVHSCIRLNTANGYGSTNTVIRRFTNTVLNQGSDITYSDSATLGASFTINADGVYAISYNDGTSGTMAIGLTLNSTQLTTAINSTTVSTRLANIISSTVNFCGSAPWCGYLPSGSVVRPHTDGTGPASSQAAQFTITRVA